MARRNVCQVARTNAFEVVCRGGILSLMLGAPKRPLHLYLSLFGSIPDNMIGCSCKRVDNAPGTLLRLAPTTSSSSTMLASSTVLEKACVVDCLLGVLVLVQSARCLSVIRRVLLAAKCWVRANFFFWPSIRS